VAGEGDGLDADGLRWITVNPLSLALGAEATFVARAMDIDKPGLTDVLKAAAHKGAAFVEIYQNCNIYNDGAFDFVREEKEKPPVHRARQAGRRHGHHARRDRLRHGVRAVTDQLRATWRRPLGVFRDVPRDSYDELVQAQLDNAKGDGDLQALVGSGDTWSI